MFVRHKRIHQNRTYQRHLVTASYQQCYPLQQRPPWLGVSPSQLQSNGSRRVLANRPRPYCKLPHPIPNIFNIHTNTLVIKIYDNMQCDLQAAIRSSWFHPSRSICPVRVCKGDNRVETNNSPRPVCVTLLLISICGRHDGMTVFKPGANNMAEVKHKTQDNILNTEHRCPHLEDEDY